jgi:hypothetical protein
VFNGMAGYKMGGAASGATALRAFAHRSRNGGMACKPQVVIARKIDELPPVNNSRYAAARFNEGIDRPPLTAQMLAIQLVECGPQLRRPTLH